jgi:hypothetical protein
MILGNQSVIVPIEIDGRYMIANGEKYLNGAGKLLDIRAVIPILV